MTKLRAALAALGVVGTLAGTVVGTAEFVKPEEGTVHRTYVDPVGVATACTGNTSAAVPGATYTAAECELLLLSDVIVAVVASGKLVKVELTEEEWIAVSSFTYNLGWRALQKSTLLAKLNAGDKAGAAKEFKRWVYGGGRVLPGLVVRRAREAVLFLS